MDDAHVPSTPATGPQQKPPPAAEGKRRGSAFWLALIAGILLLGSMLFNGIFMLVIMALSAGQVVDQNRMVDEVVREGSTERCILLIELDGVISGESEETLLGNRPSIVERIQRQLRQARDDDRVAAVVLGLNTPGGGVTASDQIHKAIVRFREETGVPVFAHMGTLCASGGYYVAMACDRVEASPTTVTGSIGVIMALVNAKTLLVDKLGIRSTPIVSGKHKDIGSPFDDMSPEEEAILQDIVDRMYDRFVDLIVDNRMQAEVFAGQSREQVREAILAQADGRVLHAEQALRQGLVDGLDYRHELYERLRDQLGLGDAAVIGYKPRPQGLAALFAARAASDPIGRVAEELKSSSTPRFEYRWQPGLMP